MSDIEESSSEAHDSGSVYPLEGNSDIGTQKDGRRISNLIWNHMTRNKVDGKVCITVSK